MSENEEVYEKPSIIVISDFVCPWCYIGLSEVERLSKEYDIEVEFAPFFLRPDTPPEGMTHTARSRRPTPRRRRRSCARSRWASTSPVAAPGCRTPTSPWRRPSSPASTATSGASTRRCSRPTSRTSRTSATSRRIVQVGVSAGLPEQALRDALTERRYQERVDQGIAWSRSIGVTAIPTFVFNDKYGMVGAQELPAFREMLTKLGHQPRAEAAAQ